MKIIKAEINKFGCLKNKTIEFKEGLNTFIEDNGSGKTTTAAFIKAMLFGMEKLRSNAKKEDFLEREHYCPYGETSFGGSLTIEVNNETYRIEKTFDVKSETKDKTKILDKDGNEVLKGINIGEHFFGIDRESFERTAFISSTDLDVDRTDSIKKKLYGIVQGTTNTLTYEDVVENIKEDMKKIKRVGNRGSKGDLDKEQDNLLELEKQLSDIAIVEKARDSKFEERKKINDELKDVEMQLGASKDQDIEKARWNAYETKLKDIETAKAEKDEILAKYPKGFPTEEAINDLGNAINKKQSQEAILKEKVLIPTERGELEKLKEKYQEGPLSEEEASTLKDKAWKVSQLKSNGVNSSFTGIDEEKLNKLSTSFKEGIPADEEIALEETKIQEINRLEVLLSSSEEASTESERRLESEFIDGTPSKEELASIEEKAKKHKDNLSKKLALANNLTITVKGNEKPNNLPKIVGSAALALGIILAVVGAIITNIPLIIVGVVLALVGVAAFFIKLGGPKEVTSVNESAQKELSAIDVENAPLSDELSAFFARFRISGSEFSNNLERLKTDIADFEAIKYRKENKASDKKANEEKLAALKEETKSFFEKYGIKDDKNAIITLKTDIAEYQRLKAAKEAKEGKEEETKAVIEENLKTIDELLAKYGIVRQEDVYEQAKAIELESKTLRNLMEKDTCFNNAAKLQEESDATVKAMLKDLGRKEDDDPVQVKNDLNKDDVKLRSLIEDIEKKTIDAASYKKDNNLPDEKPEFVEIEVDVAALEAKKAELGKDLLVKDNEIESDTNQIDEKANIEERIANTKESIEKYAQKHNILELTMKYLEQAEEVLRKKYIGPIEQRFQDYANEMNKVVGENAKMGMDFSVTFNNSGVTARQEHLSEGQKACLSLCIRFALLDEMYKGEKPFITLDDPLIYLDEKNIGSALSTIKSLSEGSQILYYTCHESRKPE